MCVCLYVCIYIYIYIDRYTHTYTYIRTSESKCLVSTPILDSTLDSRQGQDGGVEDTWPWAVRDSHHPYRKLEKERIAAGWRPRKLAKLVNISPSSLWFLLVIWDYIGLLVIIIYG